MLRQIKVADLCNELEKQLEKLQYSEDSMRRYRKVFREFDEYTGDCYYSQSKGTDFLLWKFNQLGGFVTSGEHSKNEMYYFRVIRSLAEYFNFGTIFRRNDYHGEIVWPIHSLFRYIQMQSPEYLFQCQQILGIPYKKAEKHPVGYLSEDETKTLLSTPDTSTRKGRRDQALLTLLYDSGARVQELVDLRVGDLRLNTPAQVKLTGKGRKTRCVPLMDKTVALLRQYLLENNIDTPVSFEHPLFFNSQRKKLTRQGVAYILCKYADLCNIQQVSPHKLRHTKAMHLTEADVNPIFIRDFLGHTDLKVTEIYSKTSIKMKKAALDKMNSGKTVIPDKPVKDWTNDNSLLDWLNGLKR